MLTRTIIAKPIGGLANRMRFLDCIYYLAQQIRSKVTLLWGLEGMDCSFDRLFHAPVLVKVRDTRKPLTRLLACKFEPFVRRYRAIGWDDAMAIADNMTEWRRIVDASDVMISGCDRFLRVERPYSTLSINTRVMARVDEIVSHWDVSMLGVHIRRGDNKRSVDRSPTDEFVRRIDREIDRNKDFHLFLATDDYHEEISLVRRYGQRVQIFKKTSRDRYSPIAAEEALIDLLCLSRTQKIIGSYWSSFSWEAARLGRVPLDEVYIPGDSNGSQIT